VVLFSADENRKTGKLFQWVGPVGKKQRHILRKKGLRHKNKQSGGCQELKAIATTTNWFTEQYLKGKGFTNLIAPSSNNERKAAHGRGCTGFHFYRHYHTKRCEKGRIQHGRFGARFYG
jgi:hypothetical protein